MKPVRQPTLSAPCGRMHVQRDGFTYVGCVLDVVTQRNSVVLYVALTDQPFTIESPDHPTLHATAAVVASGVHNRFIGGWPPVACIDIAPTHRSFRALARVCSGVEAWPHGHFAGLVDEFHSFLDGQMPGAQASDLYARTIDLAVQRTRAVQPLDARIRKVMRLLRESPGLTVEELGDAVGLSKHWLMHLFVSEAGITLRKYEQTLKLQMAAAYLRRGISLTEVAANAGFADLAHFSNLWKQHYGFPPQRSFKSHELDIDPIPWPTCLEATPPGAEEYQPGRRNFMAAGSTA